MGVSENQTPPSPQTSDTLLVEIWKQLNDELRHRDTMFMQILVCVFLFLSAFAAVIYYIPQGRWWIWSLGFVCLIAACFYVRMIGKGQKKCYEAALQVQRNFTCPNDIKERLTQLMNERRPRFSTRPVQVFFSVLGILLWVYIGFTTVFGSYIISILKAILCNA